jgi:hypothetical protein
LLIVSGAFILLLCSLLQEAQAPLKGEYYYSSFFRNNFILPVKALFCIAGFFAGFRYQLNPWLSGICLNAVFPMVSIIEGVAYKGSHNLIPVEFAYHLWLALPAVAAAYIGRSLQGRLAKRKGKLPEKL